MVQPTRKDFLNKKTVKDLRKIAGKLGRESKIPYYNKLNKSNLVFELMKRTRLNNGVLYNFTNKRL